MKAGQAEVDVTREYRILSGKKRASTKVDRPAKAPTDSMLLYSYVVEHDNGFAPNPFHNYCTLAHCKFSHDGMRKNIVELATKDDWIVGTGGANLYKSAGHGRIVYAMKVTDIKTLTEYFHERGFEAKKPKNASDWQADNRKELLAAGRRVLISDYFYYFGRNAVRIPKRFAVIEKRGPGFKSRFDKEFIDKFVAWLA
ncbi:MAG: hypothetical protein A2W66_06305, partial [Deltaproteobacteria bacterium RIFCSPLOWO2_02_56_12]